MTGFEINSWGGLVAPANTPKDIATTLNTEIRRIGADPSPKARFAEIGTEVLSSTPEEMGDLIKADLVKWAKMIKDDRAPVGPSHEVRLQHWLSSKRHEESASHPIAYPVPTFQESAGRQTTD